MARIHIPMETGYSPWSKSELMTILWKRWVDSPFGRIVREPCSLSPVVMLQGKAHHERQFKRHYGPNPISQAYVETVLTCPWPESMRLLRC